MRLICFGKVHLEDTTFSRPKPLLLLAYLTLQGQQSRGTLAELFWNDPKAKSNLSVMLSQFKKEGASSALPDQPGADPLVSLVTADALEFTDLLQRGDLEAALNVYAGSFLGDLGKALEDLEVSGELLDWVTLKREWYAQQAQAALLTLAEQKLQRDDIQSARAWAERAYALADAPELEPAVTAQLQRLLSQTGSAHAKNLERSAKDGLNDLSLATRSVFLALSLQQHTNLAIVRNALELSLSELAEAQENLFMLGLIDAKAQVLAPELAASWLGTHPRDRLPLLLSMARATPSAEAFGLYRRTFEDTQGFGGLGDVQKARTAYTLQAKTLMDSLEFKQVIALLAEVRSAETVMGVEPEADSIFLHAYALERSGQFKEALELLLKLPPAQHNENLRALKSVLLWRAGRTGEAQEVARSVLSSGPDSLWAQATAYNTLGYLASSSGEFAEAVSNFKKSAEYYEAAGDKHRWVGALNNQAVELTRMAEHAKRLFEPPEVIETFLVKADVVYQQTLDGLKSLVVGNKALEGRILLNMGKISETRQNWVEAKRRYARAEEAISGLELHGLSARIKLNLGIIARHMKSTSDAILCFKETISKASLAGEPQIQALAMNHLAILNNDIDQIEVSLDLMQKTGGLDLARAAIVDYRNILRRDAEQSLQSGDLDQMRRTLERLQRLHLRLGHTHLAQKVASAIQTILEIAPAPIQFDLSDLFRELDFKEVVHTT